MKLLHVAPIYESVPPTKYGGAEEMIYYLVNGLAEHRHSVGLISSGDSNTKAKLLPVFNRHYNYLLEHDSKEIPEDSTFAILYQDLVAYRQKGYDIVHNHFYGRHSYGKLMLANAYENTIPTVITVHNEIDSTQIGELIFNEYTHVNYIFLSQAQRNRHRRLNSAGVVYNAVDNKEFTYSDRAADYYYWISKVIPQKGTREAIESAQKASVKLLISGNPDLSKYEDYWKKDIKPLFNDKNIIFKGEADLTTKVKYYHHARATIFPSRHNEGCPMVPLESLSCGTPVIAFDNPVVMEIIKDGYNGFVCKDISGLIRAIKNIESMSHSAYSAMRQNCRKTVLEKFSIEKMVDGYEKIYQKVLEDWHHKHQ